MWKKGQSGNPGGDRKRRLISGHIERELIAAVEGEDTTKARKIARKVVDMAVEGNAWAVQFVTERTEGKPDQHVSISREIRELSDADLAEIASGSGDGVVEEAGSEAKPSVVH